ncbi:MAG: SAM-dependent methyltransferase [Myxococcota bacterium]
MRDAPSVTAAWVAVWRTLGRRLPPAARLADDPYGASFARLPTRTLARWAPTAMTVPMWPAVLYMQVRTRAIDDVLRAFVAGGGRQVAILGAGYDCRASRFAAELGQTRVFEIDHPATQARKRRVLPPHPGPGPDVTYLAWDFEQRPVSELPGALGALGHDPTLPTLTVWEGVTMYLTEGAIDASVRAVATLSAPGSPFVISYLDKQYVDHPSVARVVVGRAVATIGEPFRFGWDPSALPAWFAERGFDTTWDASMNELGRRLLPARYSRLLQIGGHRIALVTRR